MKYKLEIFEYFKIHKAETIKNSEEKFKILWSDGGVNISQINF
jgi:hypothetical protein